MDVYCSPKNVHSDGSDTQDSGPQEKLRIVIGGGTGFVGKALAESLRDKGHEVIIIARFTTSLVDLPRNDMCVGGRCDNAGVL